MKRRSVYSALLDADVMRVWEIMRNNEDTAWRSDLDSVKVVSEDTFEEYTVNGKKTTFHISRSVPGKEYAFTMENGLFTGIWSGTFEKVAPEKTRLVLNELLNIKNPLIWLCSFLAFPLQKIQRQYVEDLKKKLAE